MAIDLRAERADDAAAVRRVNEAAFGRPGEADLVDALRAAGAVIVSLVAEAEGEVVGHILFSPASLFAHSDEVTDAGQGEGATTMAALGPMAVLPAWQGRGIGGQLIRAGLEACRAAGYDLCIVLGHTSYYPRFGFRPAAPLGIRWEHGGGEAFMVTELRPGALAGRGGVARYRPEFDGV